MNFLEQMQDSNDPMIVMIKNHLLSRNDTSELCILKGYTKQEFLYS